MALGLQLLVFDSRRGNREGEELQKVLAFHPAETPPVEQITTAGLLHGLLLFSSNFCQDGWEVAETDKSVWVAHQAEPSIWFALAAPRTWVPRHCAEANLQSLLAQAHQIISLLHGPIEGLLLQDASGHSTRRAIQPVLEHLGRQLGNMLSWQHRQLRNPLGDVALVPQLQLAPPASMAVQNFVNAVQLTGVGGSRAVEGVMLLHQAHVLWSSLAPEDSAALYSLAATALLHPPSGMQRGGEAREQSVLDSSCWHQLPSKFVVLRPGVAPGQEGAAAAQQDGEMVQVPSVLIQSGQERCHLLPYKEGKLWVLLLVAAAVTLSAHALSTLQAVLAAPAQQLAAQVSQEVRTQSAEPGHVPGYRYLYRDLGASACTASPRVKISAMLHHSRALAVAVRESLAQLEPAPGGDALCGWENGSWEGGSSGGRQLGGQGAQGVGPEGSSDSSAAGGRPPAQWTGPAAQAQHGQHAQHGGNEGQSRGSSEEGQPSGAGSGGKGWMAAGQGHFGPGKWLRSPRESLEQQGLARPGSQSPADEARAASLTPLRLGPPALRWQSLERGHPGNIYSPPAELRGSASIAFDAEESTGQGGSSSSLSQALEQQAELATAEALVLAVQQLGLRDPQPAAAAVGADRLPHGEASSGAAAAGGSSSAAAAAATAAAVGTAQQQEGAEQGREHGQQAQQAQEAQQAQQPDATALAAESSGADSVGSEPGSPASSAAGPTAAAAPQAEPPGHLKDEHDDWGRATDAAELDSWESSSEPAPPPVVDIPPAVGANDVHEVFVRSSQDCWAAARVGLRLSRQLLVVRERKTERNLGEAMAVMDAFTDSFPC